MLKQVEMSVLLLLQSCLNERVEISTRVFFVRFLLSLLNFMPPAPSHLTCLRTFAPSFLTLIWALQALFTQLARFCVFVSLRALYALFVHLNIALGWDFIPAKTHNFPITVKGTTNCAAFKWIKKQQLKFLKGGGLYANISIVNLSAKI